MFSCWANTLEDHLALNFFSDGAFSIKSTIGKNSICQCSKHFCNKHLACNVHTTKRKQHTYSKCRLKQRVATWLERKIRSYWNSVIFSGIRGPYGIRCDSSFAQETSEAEVQHQLRPQEDVPQRGRVLRAASTADSGVAAAGQEEEDPGVTGRQRNHHVGRGRNRGAETDGKPWNDVTVSERI